MRRPRGFDLALIVVLLPLGVWAWRTGVERAGLEAKFARYSRKSAELEIGDSSKLTLRAVDTDETFHFAWRVLLPPGEYDQVNNLGFASSLIATDSQPIVYRYRIDEADADQLRFYSGNTLPGRFDPRDNVERAGSHQAPPRPMGSDHHRANGGDRTGRR